MKFVAQGVQKKAPEQTDKNTHTQTEATKKITFPHSRLVINKIKPLTTPRSSPLPDYTRIN